jgi:GNAT superfamily N-acetyltransferase
MAGVIRKQERSRTPFPICPGLARAAPTGITAGMAPTIRLAQATDARVFENVHEDVFDNPPDPDLVARFLAAPHLHIAVALEGGRMIGMCSGVTYHHPDKPPQWWVNELGIAEPWRRQGLATRLVDLCAEEAARLGCTEIWVVADPAPMAEGFWSSLGWTRTGERLAMFGRRLRP